MLWYAGIGSRRTPWSFKYKIIGIAQCLARSGFGLHSGGCPIGPDKWFEYGHGTINDSMKIFLPEPGYGGHASQYHTPSPEAFELAALYHPKWKACSEKAKALHARNSHIILGEDLKSPVAFVVCHTPSGEAEGGTGQGIRIARAYGIEVFNLQRDGEHARLIDFVVSSTRQSAAFEFKSSKTMEPLAAIGPVQSGTFRPYK